MRRNRLILLLYIVLTVVFVSFYGGYISYGLFFMGLLIPLVSFLYLGYVYIRFRIYQIIERKTMVKGEHIAYQFILANEDLITFTNVNVTFCKDYSMVENLSSDRSYCLLPGDRVEQKTTICCYYRGEYAVGVSQVIVTDYLNLFCLRYAAPSPINVKVFPRIVQINQLKMLKETEGKNIRWNPMVKQNVPDTEVRNYEPGDLAKMIHWKAVARQQKLVTRKYTDEPKTEIVLYMDLIRKDTEGIDRIILEDKIIETTLALCHYFYKNNTPVRMVYDLAGIRMMNITGKHDFDLFYQLSTEVSFRATMTMDKLLSESGHLIKSRTFNIIITHTMSIPFVLSCLQKVNLGNDVILVYIGAEDVSSMYDKLDNRIVFLSIRPDQEITEVLES